MVKGVSKQVIVVRPQDRALFEQAIFILKDGSEAVTDAELLQQARRAADDYLRVGTRGGRGQGWRMAPVVFALLGAFMASVLWAVGLVLY